MGAPGAAACGRNAHDCARQPSSTSVDTDARKDAHGISFTLPLMLAKRSRANANKKEGLEGLSTNP